MADPQAPTSSPRPPEAGGRHLRLVRSTPEPIGPISPELVLVSPEIARAVGGTPDVLVTGEERPDGPVTSPGPPAPFRYDTSDLLLERHGFTLELGAPDGGSTWRLTLPRGEVVEEAATSGGIPSRITALLDPLVGDGDLRRVPRRSPNAEIELLEARLSAERRSLLAHDAGTRLALDAENLHQLRVASRRIRAYLRVARKLVDERWSAEVDVPLRRLGRASGPARDLDVLIEHLRAEVATLEPTDAAAAAELIGAFEDERDDLQDELLHVLDDDAHRRLVETLGLPVEAAADLTTRTLGELAERELRRLLATVRKLGRTPPDEELHAMRLKVKRVRYATELGGVPGGNRTARVVRAATALQDLLGEHQDAVVAEERIRSVAERIDDARVSFAAGRLAERQHARREAIQAQLPAAWRRLRKLCV